MDKRLLDKKGSKEKRVFVPKIPQRRIKKEPEVKCELQPQDENRGRERGRDRGRGRGKQQFVQTEGTLFGEGIKSIPKIVPKVEVSRTGKSTLQKPVHNKSTKLTIDDPLKPNDEIVKKEFLESSDEDEPDLNEQFQRITLPMQPSMRDIKPQIKIEKPLIAIKKEPLDCFPRMVKSEPLDSFSKVIKTEPLDEVFSAVNVEPKFDSLKPEFMNEISEFMLWQLPDRLPFGKPPCKIEDSMHSDRLTNSGGCILTELEEGRIGKLQFLSSGHMRLKLGNTLFHLDVQEIPFLHELAILDNDKLQLATLGSITKKAICMSGVFG